MSFRQWRDISWADPLLLNSPALPLSSVVPTQLFLWLLSELIKLKNNMRESFNQMNFLIWFTVQQYSLYTVWHNQVGTSHMRLVQPVFSLQNYISQLPTYIKVCIEVPGTQAVLPFHELSKRSNLWQRLRWIIEQSFRSLMSSNNLFNKASEMSSGTLANIPLFAHAFKPAQAMPMFGHVLCVYAGQCLSSSACLLRNYKQLWKTKEVMLCVCTVSIYASMSNEHGKSRAEQLFKRTLISKFGNSKES